MCTRKRRILIVKAPQISEKTQKIILKKIAFVIFKEKNCMKLTVVSILAESVGRFVQQEPCDRYGSVQTNDTSPQRNTQTAFSLL